MELDAKKIIEDNTELISDDINRQHKNWEKFYKFNKTNFFKDRHYILREFAEMKDDERVGYKLIYRRRLNY